MVIVPNITYESCYYLFILLPSKVLNFHLLVFQIKLKYHCSSAINCVTWEKKQASLRHPSRGKMQCGMAAVISSLDRKSVLNSVPTEEKDLNFTYGYNVRSTSLDNLVYFDQSLLNNLPIFLSVFFFSVKGSKEAICSHRSCQPKRQDLSSQHKFFNYVSVYNTPTHRY